MKKLLLLSALLFTAAHAAKADIDLTPTASVRILEGCKFPQLEFHDDRTAITYEAPKGWDYSPAGKHALILRAKDKVQADAKIEVIPAPEKLSFDEEQLKKLKAELAALLPRNSERVELGEASVNPIRINGHPTCEVSASFVLFGQKYKTSVLFVDLGASQLRFSLSCLNSDFEELHKAFSGSWYSWQWL